MAIKMRRGKLKDFDPEKMTPSEIAVTNETDVEKQKVFACFVPGAVKQMATYEDMERNVETALSEASQGILEGIAKDINSAIDSANTAAENAQDAADNVSQALNNANTATENANKAAGLANEAYINYQNNTATTAEKLSGEHRIDGAKFQGDADVHHYGVCNSAASAQVKQVDIPNINMSYGTRIDVKFTHGNTADNPKLQLNTWPAYPITYKGNPVPASYIMEKSLLTLEYDLGEKWHVVGDLAQAQVDALLDKLDNMTDRIRYVIASATWEKQEVGPLIDSDSWTIIDSLLKRVGVSADEFGSVPIPFASGEKQQFVIRLYANQTNTPYVYTGAYNGEDTSILRSPKIIWSSDGTPGEKFIFLELSDSNGFLCVNTNEKNGSKILEIYRNNGEKVNWKSS